MTKSKEELARDHSIEVFPVNWGDQKLHEVNRQNAIDSFLAGYDARQAEVDELKIDVQSLHWRNDGLHLKNCTLENEIQELKKEIEYLRRCSDKDSVAMAYELLKESKDGK